MTSAEILFFALVYGLALIVPSFLVAGEFALVALRYGSLGQSGNPLDNRPLLKYLVENGDRTARVIRFGKTACLILTGVLTLTGITLWFPEWHGNWQGWAFILAGGIVFLVLHYLLVELVPRGLALHNPLRALAFTAPVLVVATALAFPLLRLLRPTKVLLYRFLKLNVEEDLSPLDVEVQIRALGEDTPTLTSPVRKIISRALNLHELDAHDILLPRNQVQFMDIFDNYEENVSLARRLGHTRFPLCQGDLDKCIGLIHIKDLFRQPEKRDLRTVRRNIISVRDNDRLDVILTRLLSNRMHMALVVDAFGGAVGIITLEAILEELVGDIQDEFDNEEALIKDSPDGKFIIAGLTPLHDIEELLSIEFDAEDVSTFGGLITSELGRIPDKGEEVRLRNLVITVTEVDERRVISAQLEIVPTHDESDKDKDEESEKNES
jgi:CBS domain containing-hemolysin-like protein